MLPFCRLNALGEVQSDHTKRLQRIEDKADNTEVWLGHLNGRMDLLTNQMIGFGGRLDGIDTRLGRVDDKLDKVDTRLDGVETGLAGVKAGVDAILDRLGNG